jgi:ribosomal protein S27AE
MLLTDKRCPKCGGNVYLNEDYNGEWLECLQCGWNDEQDKVNLNDIDLPKARRCLTKIKKQK